MGEEARGREERRGKGEEGRNGRDMRA